MSRTGEAGVRDAAPRPARSEGGRAVSRTGEVGVPTGTSDMWTAGGEGHLLRARGLVVRDATGRALVDGVDLDVRPGERVGVVGESGAGKTLTLRACLGLLPDGLSCGAAELTLDGRDMRTARPREMRELLGTRVGFIPQNTMEYLHPLMRVRDQMIDGWRTWHRGAPKAQAVAQAAELLGRVGIDDPARVLAARPGELSGGMRQRVNVACALMGEPALLVADEPTASLDARIARQVIELITQVAAERGIAVALVSHDLGMVQAYCDRLLVMRAGHVVESGSSADVFGAPRDPYTRTLVAAMPRLADVLAARSGEQADSAPVLEAHDDARGGSRPAFATHESSDLDARHRRTAGTVPAHVRVGASVLEARDVTRRFRLGRGRDLTAVDGVSLTLRAGRTLGIVGESGSGKSTLGEVLGGLQPTDGGSVLFGGVDVAGLDRTGRRAYRRGVQFVFQDPVASINPSFTVARALADPQQVLLPGLSRVEIDERSRAMLRRVGLDPARVMEARARELSGGQCQRVAIARALVSEPSVIVCDECTSALDVGVQAQILDLLRELQAELGCAYLFISHDMGAIARLADDVLVMRAGRVVEAGPVAEVLSAPSDPYTRALIAAAFLRSDDAGEPGDSDGARADEGADGVSRGGALAAGEEAAR